jgi:hypothetical protein
MTYIPLGIPLQMELLDYHLANILKSVDNTDMEKEENREGCKKELYSLFNSLFWRLKLQD